jgi:hypothetical protein
LHQAKQRRRIKRRQKPGVAGGGEPGDEPRTGKIYKGNLLKCCRRRLDDWRESKFHTAASIEIIYGASDFFFSIQVQNFAGLMH